MVQTILEQVFLMCGGLMLLMFGMNFMGANLQKAAGGKIKKWLNKVTNNRIAGVGIGMGVTALIQSSAATTVMLVGFVNIGMLTMAQAATVIMGANIGTTITAQIVALESVNLFDVTAIFSLLAGVGFICSLVAKKKMVRVVGRIFMGLGMIFLGLEFMSSSVKVLIDEVPSITKVFSAVKNPVLLLIIGIVFTALIQSSSTVTSIVIVLAGTTSGAGIPVLGLVQAMYITLGSNIGTCITAILSAMGTDVNARRTAVIHLLFNVIGCCIVLVPLLIWQNEIAKAMVSLSGTNIQRQIANFHTIFNVVVTLCLLPFTKGLVFLATKIVKDKKGVKVAGENRLQYLDPLILETPMVAVGLVKSEIIHMGSLAFKNYERAVNSLVEAEEDVVEEFNKTEDDINFLNREISSYLVKIIASDINTQDKKTLSTYYRVISDIERIGDYAENLMEYGDRMREENLQFSDDAKKEIMQVFEDSRALYLDVMYTFDTRSLDRMPAIIEIEERVDGAKDRMGNAHIDRLNQGLCTPVTGAMYLSTANNMERIADHMVNVANSVARNNA